MLLQDWEIFVDEPGNRDVIHTAHSSFRSTWYQHLPHRKNSRKDKETPTPSFTYSAIFVGPAATTSLNNNGTKSKRLFELWETFGYFDTNERRTIRKKEASEQFDLLYVRQIIFLLRLSRFLIISKQCGSRVACIAISLLTLFSASKSLHGKHRIYTRFPNSRR